MPTYDQEPGCLKEIRISASSTAGKVKAQSGVIDPRESDVLHAFVERRVAIEERRTDSSAGLPQRVAHERHALVVRLGRSFTIDARPYLPSLGIIHLSRSPLSRTRDTNHGSALKATREADLFPPAVCAFTDGLSVLSGCAASKEYHLVAVAGPSDGHRGTSSGTPHEPARVRAGCGWSARRLPHVTCGSRKSRFGGAIGKRPVKPATGFRQTRKSPAITIG